MSPSSTGVTLTWLADGLKAGSAQELQAVAVQERVPPRVVVTDHPGQAQVAVHIGKQAVTSYHYGDTWARPFLYPVLGPENKGVTRGWPVNRKIAGEHRDHPHHKSIWVAHGECDTVDNWSEEPGHGVQRHQGFEVLESGPVLGRISARNFWCNASGRKQFEELREMRFYALPGGTRLFDVQATFRMTDKAVTFRDTKEGGLLSVRVASALDVRHGGRIENGFGGINESETWGCPAPWCDYSGQVDGVGVGIAVFDHPENPRFPTQWHVRDYGLMTANCFAWSHYRPEAKVRGDMIFKKGQETQWKYRVYVHRGDARQGKVAGHYLDFFAPPAVRVSGAAG